MALLVPLRYLNFEPRTDGPASDAGHKAPMTAAPVGWGGGAGLHGRGFGGLG